MPVKPSYAVALLWKSLPNSPLALSWRERFVALRRSLPLQPKTVITGVNTSLLFPLVTCVCADFESNQECEGALLKCAKHWLRTLLFTERLLFGMSLELWRGMKTTVRVWFGHRMKHKRYIFCAGLTVAAWVTAWPVFLATACRRMLVANKGFALHASTMACIFYWKFQQAKSWWI